MFPGTNFQINWTFATCVFSSVSMDTGRTGLQQSIKYRKKSSVNPFKNKNEKEKKTQKVDNDFSICILKLQV